ncbi:hypothetical protein NDU88_007499 [Pleurodeles waltl]|uniref:Uncharacterized protein n=1 Tax=Pleurodeles waltl TaxID=8319 RepID=A0AAV7QL40_PLEWA|nr:hypothetical protein NDU88_007499 [Pleurodeles waltl]
MLLLVFGFYVALLNYIALAWRFGAGGVFKMVQRGLTTLQYLRMSGGRAWGPPGYCPGYLRALVSSKGAQEARGACVRLASAADVASVSRSLNGAGPPRRSSRADKPPLTAFGEPRLSTRSRPRLLRFFGASSTRAPPSAIVRRGRTPRAPHGVVVCRSL